MDLVYWWLKTFIVNHMSLSQKYVTDYVTNNVCIDIITILYYNVTTTYKWKGKCCMVLDQCCIKFWEKCIVLFVEKGHNWHRKCSWSSAGIYGIGSELTKHTAHLFVLLSHLSISFDLFLGRDQGGKKSSFLLKHIFNSTLLVRLTFFQWYRKDSTFVLEELC